jgi:hypothetical protein
MISQTNIALQPIAIARDEPSIFSINHGDSTNVSYQKDD